MSRRGAAQDRDENDVVDAEDDFESGQRQQPYPSIWIGEPSHVCIPPPKEWPNVSRSCITWGRACVLFLNRRPTPNTLGTVGKNHGRHLAADSRRRRNHHL